MTQPSKEAIYKFCDAARGGNLGKIRELLDIHHGAIVNERDTLEMTALAWAAHAGHIDIIQLLVDNGADLDIKCHSQKTALAWAAYMSKVSSVQLLLDLGAATNIPDDEGNTAATVARQKGYAGLAKMIEEAKPRPRPSTGTGPSRREQLKNLRPSTPTLKKPKP